MSTYSSGNLVVVGDFNSVMRNALDMVSGRTHSTEEVIKFGHAITELNPTDLWRIFHEEEREYTWCRFHPFIVRRLFFLVVVLDLFVHTLCRFFSFFFHLRFLYSLLTVFGGSTSIRQAC